MRKKLLSLLFLQIVSLRCAGEQIPSRFILPDALQNLHAINIANAEGSSPETYLVSCGNRRAILFMDRIHQAPEARSFVLENFGFGPFIQMGIHDLNWLRDGNHGMFLIMGYALIRAIRHYSSTEQLHMLNLIHQNIREKLRERAGLSLPPDLYTGVLEPLRTVTEITRELMYDMRFELSLDEKCGIKFPKEPVVDLEPNLIEGVHFIYTNAESIVVLPRQTGGIRIVDLGAVMVVQEGLDWVQGLINYDGLFVIFLRLAFRHIVNGRIARGDAAARTIRDEIEAQITPSTTTSVAAQLYVDGLMQLLRP